ncbi:MAG TPA: ATP-binding protein [Acidimicrobiales bacterium]|nr:ATP-binding protein [Acidimicrobiales bacterium]
MRKCVAGATTGVLSAVALGALMFPFRAHMAIATAALVLVVPVVAGVVSGGLLAGLLSVAAGFLVYDYVFVPPYGTLTVGTTQDWGALGVYAVVTVIVARVVASLDRARQASRARETSTRHLLDLSELLLLEKPPAELARSVVNWAQQALGVQGAALLTATVDEQLQVAASSGVPIGDEELAQLQPGAGLPVHLSTGTSSHALQALALATSGRPVGLLVMRDVPAEPAVRDLLPILANHVAAALERAQLRERAQQVELLEEVDRLRRSLIGAVSHDLRTPLATIKVASSTLLDKASDLSPAGADELHSLIDMQADRLGRLVNSLLDMTRIQAGSLQVRPQPWPLATLVAEAVFGLQSSLGECEVRTEIGDNVPLVAVDPLLIVQVLANLLDNAHRHGPWGTPVIVSARPIDSGQEVQVSVTDQGRGVPPAEREAIFERFVRFDTGGRSGLGLAIAKAFIEAHGERIWVEEAPEGGARFVFTLPAVAVARDN